jgi:hypothetical protein
MMLRELISDIKRYGGIKGYFTTLMDKRARKGRHSQDYIHLFYVTPELYVGAQA